MFTVVALIAGVPGVNTLQHVTVVTDSAFLVTSSLTKLPNVKWVTVAVLIGRDGLVVVSTLATKMFDCYSAEAALDHLNFYMERP